MAEAALDAPPNARPVDGAGVDKNGVPVRVPASEPLPAHNPRSDRVEAVGREVAVAHAPRQDNKAEAEVRKPVLALNPRALAEAAQLVDTRVAVPRGRTAPVVLRAVLAAAEEVVVPGVALVGVEVVVEEAVEVVGVRAGAGAVVGVNAKVQSGDQAQE